MGHSEEARPMTLPEFVIGPVDVNRLRREVEGLDEYIEQANSRQKGQGSAKLPRTSRSLEEFAKLNGLNLLEANSRNQTRKYLERLTEQAPVISISFASDPSAAFMVKIVNWFRENIHPEALLRLGLQPSIAAGCVIRTANKQFDLSLRQNLAKQRPLLIQELEGSSAQTPGASEAQT